jgi:hypothetical protein
MTIFGGYDLFATHNDNGGKKAKSTQKKAARE